MNPTYMLPKNLPSIEMHYIGNLRVVLTLTLQPDLVRPHHCVKSVQIRIFFCPYFRVFGLKTDQKKIRIWTISTQCMLCLSDYYLGSSTRPLKLS